MLTSADWINAYLDPPASPEEQAELLTRAGFPLEASEKLSGGDVQQDFEMTSNRGDCVCHVGLAREIAAISDRTLELPAVSVAATGAPAADQVSVTNREPEACPLYTARIIRGVKVGPSPDWLANRLRSIDQIPRNNIVDASNFVLFECGQPTHCFDLATLAGPRIIVRRARRDEPFLPIGEGAAEVRLGERDLVIADAENAVAIAGVKGGALTAVSEGTTDLLLEAATFDPVAVRTTSRRLGIESDSSYRFERGVHPGQVNAAAERLAALILELAGGELAEGVVADGAPIPGPRRVSMRPDRCRQLLGLQVTDEHMIRRLAALGFRPVASGDVLQCTVPCHRLDVEREIDLIEEVARLTGLEQLPVAESVQIRVAPLQPRELARQAVNDALVGMGFVEAVTHGMVEARDADLFLGPGEQALRLDTSGATVGHAQAGTVLRPSVLPSLLRVLARNHDNGVPALRIFESAATFRRGPGGPDERRTTALLMDRQHPDEGTRPLRGVVERLVSLLAGPEARVEVEPATIGWLDPGATVRLGDRVVGRLGIVASEVARSFGLDEPVAAAELELGDLAEGYPPAIEAHALPSYPAVERDVSAIVDDHVPWADLQGAIERLEPEHLEAVEFVSTYRGRQIGGGRKSVTLRVRFRAADRTLVNESVDVQVKSIVDALARELGAEIRG